ncbi:SpoIIE family protein phosphatase [Caproiciproducens faecalis]|uniref:SpoIIE family protein phosphatase n=1 Tax=Caproiciproducens faecalis TaxID=2820301 RepID=A0ABS7DPL0_9FIRM|nr:SpoIIE family protein phosphatase [Caproiciproducens faecalis]MBW7573255.1 SpoIIE family protein phosphatase [Caproiciproducens faecalis]
MKMHVDTAYRSLNKFGEELCGDKVVISRTKDATIAVLADGLGSGVKANILSTLTSSIISTMLEEGATLVEAVETIAKTLPVCNIRKLAYSTFSVIRISDSGEVSLVEFDNPPCIFVRNGRVIDLEGCSEIKDCAGKIVTETHFTVCPGDVISLVSDGIVYAGVGQALNFGWNWENVSEWLAKTTLKETSAPRLAVSLSQAVNELYLGKPGDDSTDLILKVTPRCVVSLLSGPPVHKEDDARIVHNFMTSPGKRVVCGGTSANIVSRVLNRKIETTIHYADPDVPPTGKIEGIDLVTEGVLTLSRTVEILKNYLSHQTDSYYFHVLDQPNGAAMLAKLLLEDCTDLKVYIGRAINPAHQNPGLPADLSIKIKLIEELCALVQQLGKKVEKYYY